MKKSIVLYLILICFSVSVFAQNQNRYKEVKLTPVLKVGEDNKNGYLSMPGYVFLNAKDEICVSEVRENILKVFDKKGKFLKNVGRTGEGPGEFRLMQYIENGSKGNHLFNDYALKRVSIFDNNFKFLKSVKYKERIFTLFPFKNGNYLGITNEGQSSKTQLTKYKIILFDNALNKIKNVDSLEILYIYKDKEGPVMYKYFDRLQKIRLNNGNALIMTANDYCMRVYNQNGDKIEEKKLNYSKVRINDKDKEEALKGQEDISAEARRVIDNIVYKPAFDDVFKDDKDKIYVITNEKDGENLIADVFDSGLKLLYKAKLPSGVRYSSGTISEGYLYVPVLGPGIPAPYVAKYKFEIK